MSKILQEPLRAALVGFGKVAELAHLPAIQESPAFRLAAVVDPLPERREQARELLPQARVYDDFHTLLTAEDGLNVVDLCTPPRDHAALALAALERGCHVLCEKPLTLDLGELARLKAASEKAGRALVTVHNWKYAPLLLKAAQLAGSGAMGEIRTMDWEAHRTSGSGGGLTAWRQEGGQGLGGVLVDHGWHAFYLVLRLAGGNPQRLEARLKLGSGGVDEEAEVHLHFPGLTARVFLTWRAAARRNWGRLTGTGGEMRLEDDRLVLARAAQPEEIQVFPEKLSAGSHHPQWMAGVLAEFREEIAHPESRGRNLQEASWCARFINLAYQSHADGGRRLDVPPP